MKTQNIGLIEHAMRHAARVLRAQPKIDFDSLCLHVESNFPDLDADEIESTLRHLCGKKTPGERRARQIAECAFARYMRRPAKV